MIRLLLALLRPLRALSDIAAELRILRELYEMELSSRNPPLYRVTEKPAWRRGDTEVSYAGVTDARPKWKRWGEGADWRGGAADEAEE